MKRLISYADNTPRLDRNILQSCRLLKAHQVAGKVLAILDYDEGEEGWKRYTPEFKIIVDLVAEISTDIPKRTIASRPPQTAYLSRGMGLTDPLDCTATSCTEPAIARKARCLLTKLPQSEGACLSWKIEFIKANLGAATGKHHGMPESTVPMSEIY